MLTRLDFKDFKSFQTAAIELGAFTLIVGANATGKSNVRDALRVLHGIGLGYTLAEVLGGKYGPGGIQQWRGVRGGAMELPFNKSKRFAISSVHKIEDEILWHLMSIDTSDYRFGPRVIRESLWKNGVYVFNSHPEDDRVQQRGDHQIRIRQPRGGNYRSHGRISEFASHTPALSQIPHRKSEPALLRQTCEHVLESFQSMRFLDLDPDAMREASPPGQTVLGDRGENLSSVLQAICEVPEREQQLLSWVRALTPMDATDFEFRYDLQGRVLVYLKEASGHATSAVSASDGTLRFLALVAALLSPDSGRLYFFEEFDNGIHPTRLHLLLDLVQTACATQGIQVVGTTHNPALLASLGPEALQHAVLAWRPDGAPDARLRRIVDLPDAQRVIEGHDLGQLHAAGWLENAAAFDDGDGEEQP